jgi:hypothetical protein
MAKAPTTSRPEQGGNQDSSEKMPDNPRRTANAAADTRAAAFGAITPMQRLAAIATSASTHSLLLVQCADREDIGSKTAQLGMHHLGEEQHPSTSGDDGQQYQRSSHVQTTLPVLANTRLPVPSDGAKTSRATHKSNAAAVDNQGYAYEGAFEPPAR